MNNETNEDVNFTENEVVETNEAEETQTTEENTAI